MSMCSGVPSKKEMGRKSPICVLQTHRQQQAFSVGSWMATHPPLEKRIERIDGVPVRATESGSRETQGAAVAGVSGFVDTSVTARAGEVSLQAVDEAALWLEQLDPRLRSAAGSGLGAFVVGTLCCRNRVPRKVQWPNGSIAF